MVFDKFIVSCVLEFSFRRNLCYVLTLVYAVWRYWQDLRRSTEKVLFNIMHFVYLDVTMWLFLNLLVYYF